MLRRRSQGEEPAGDPPGDLYDPGAGLPEAEGPTEFRFASWLFIRLVAAIYLIAFVSFWVQAAGLIGSRGILSVSQYLEVVATQLGPERALRVPTVFWLGSGDVAVHLVCGAGVALALLALIGFGDSLALAGAWVAYLSLTVAGQEFLSFQWDNLLLETGLLAVFLTRPWRRGDHRPPQPSKLALWLLWWLLFRLAFTSGLVKLTSGDPAWRGLSALAFHFQTQPIPNPLAWWAHQMPAAALKLATAGMFFVELVAPFAIVGPRRIRRLGAFGLAGLQVAIAATGNYAFFNLLTIALCVLLLDDAWWTRVSGRWLGLPAPFRLGPRDRPLVPLAVLIVAISSIQVLDAFRWGIDWPAPVRTVYRWVAPFRSINGYGLFQVMTTKRPEIVVEGRLDGGDWKPYRFRWKAGPLARRPPFVAPHQPRLDWQMWFAALSEPRSNPWFFLFLARLAQGSPAVLDLLADDPFDGETPDYLRARLYEYRFTRPEERRETGEWWARERRGDYLEPTPAASLARLFPVGD